MIDERMRRDFNVDTSSTRMFNKKELIEAINRTFPDDDEKYRYHNIGVVTTITTRDDNGKNIAIQNISLLKNIKLFSS